MATVEDRGRRVSGAARLAVAIAVGIVVLTGVWVSGGLITNDFELSMVLTAAWMGMAGLACLAIGWRRRELRVPVIGAYLLTAVALGVYLGRSTLVDDKVDEKVATAAPADQRATPRTASRRPPRPTNVLLRRGRFESLAHPGSGTASAIRLAKGHRVLALTSFQVDNGPDLRVYLVAGNPGDESGVKDFEDLGALKGNQGNQQYDIPPGVDLARYSTVVIWCRAFSVAFARAPLRAR